MKKKFKVLKIFLIVLGVIILGAASSLGIYAYQNMNYDKTIRRNISCRL